MKNRLLCSIFERFIVSLTCKSKIVSLKLKMTLDTLAKHNEIYKSKGFVVVKNFVSKKEAKDLENKTLNFIKKELKSTMEEI